MDYTLFEARPGLAVVLLPDSPKFTVVAVSDDFESIMGVKREDIVGKGHFEKFPANLDDPRLSGEQNVKASYEHVIKYKEPHDLPLQRYDIPNGDGTFSEKYWKAVNLPVLSETGEVRYIMHTAEDVTAHVKAEKREEAHQELEQAYLRITKSEEDLKRFKFMADNARDPFILMRKDGSFAYLNKKALQTWRYTAEEARHIRVPDVDPLYQDEAFSQIFARAQKEVIPQFETLYKRKDGLIYPVEVNMGGLTLDGKPHLFAVARDITQRKKAEEALVEKDRNIRAIINHAPVAMLVLKGENMVIDIVNYKMLKIVDKTEEISGKPLLEALPEMKGQPIIDILYCVFHTGKPFYGDGLLVPLMRNGVWEDRYFNFAYTPVIENDSVVGVMEVATEVTEQVKTRRKIEESEHQVRSLVESAPFPIGVYIGEEMRIQFANRAMIDAYGIGIDVIGRLYKEVMHEIDPEIYKRLDEVFKTGIAFHAENEHIDLIVNGNLQPYYFNYSFTPLFDAQGKVYGVMNTAADVTDLNVAHKRIEESELRFRNMVQQAPVAIALTRGRDIVIESINAPMLHIMGKEVAEEAIGKKLVEVLPEVEDQPIIGILVKVLETGEPFRGAEVPVNFMVNGYFETHYFNLSYTPVIEEGVTASVLHVAIDVTEQVLARKKIEESIEELQLAVEIADLGTFRVDLLTNKATYSQRVMDWFGFTEQGLNLEIIPAYVHPEDRANVVQALQDSLTSEANSYHDVTCCVIHSKDGVVRHLRSFGKTFFTQEGQPYLMIGTLQDVTPQMLYQQQLKTSEAELQKRVLERTLALENKNKELEQFTYAASHDMQEPLRKVETFSSMLMKLHNDQLDDKGKSLVTKISSSVHRMKSIIDDLLNYSHQTAEAQVFTPVNLNKIAEEVEDDLELVISEKKATIVKDVLPVINGVPGQINQLFFNLFSNALKFSKPGIPVRIQIKYSQPSKEESSVKGLYTHQPYIKISFTDNGIGFDQEYAEQIFSLFKRLHAKTEYEGTGIGLGLCRKIVLNHKGAIWAESEKDKGSTFHILLPG